jgi:2-isopropylmalate synthase
VTAIAIYDTTLRDGMQGQGMSLSVEEKVRVARVLDELGVPFIEAGFPASNPKEAELFERLEQESLGADVCAFGMTRRRGMRADEDPALRVLADSFAPVCTLVGKSWGLHVEKVLRVDRAENLAMIVESIAFLVERGKRVHYDAEHFFDGWRDDPEYALACVRAAAEAGAENVALCDTNGGSLPEQIAAAVRAARSTGAALGIHCHNDAECGVANSLAAVAEGAVLVQGTMNGYGERCGNANLTSIVPSLQLKLGHECLPSLEGWTEAAHYLDELLNLTADPDQRAHRSRGRRQQPRGAGLRAVRQGDGDRPRRRLARRRDRRARGRAREGARAPRLPVRGCRRLVRPLDQARDR